MSTQPQTEEYLAARRESCRLLGLNADDLTPHEMIRADLATVLRLWLDGSQSALLAGGNADPVKLLSVVEALTKLVPETEHKSRGEDPRAFMWRTYLDSRRRGELADPTSTYEGRGRRIAELEAKIAELEAGAPEESGASGGANAPRGGNVVPLARPSSAPAASPTVTNVTVAAPPSAPAYDYNANQDWKSYVNPDGSIRSTPRGRWDA